MTSVNYTVGPDLMHMVNKEAFSSFYILINKTRLISMSDKDEGILKKKSIFGVIKQLR